MLTAKTILIILVVITAIALIIFFGASVVDMFKSDEQEAAYYENWVKKENEAIGEGATLTADITMKMASLKAEPTFESVPTEEAESTEIAIEEDDSPEVVCPAIPKDWTPPSPKQAAEIVGRVNDRLEQEFGVGISDIVEVEGAVTANEVLNEDMPEEGGAVAEATDDVDSEIKVFLDKAEELSQEDSTPEAPKEITKDILLNAVTTAAKSIAEEGGDVTITEIHKYIAEKEGKKSEVKLADIREIVSIISDLIVSNPEALDSLKKNGERRLRRKKASSRKKVTKKKVTKKKVTKKKVARKKKTSRRSKK